ncbi:MAG TPA: single-stranded DNA-binding protein [Bacteroidales bacterium]|nr:single-stranded DNA-binding protein [Bacteroidales bacterium]
MNLNNRVQLIGKIVSEPIIKEFGTGKKLARFSMLTIDVFKKNEEFIKESQYHTIVAWEKTAEIIESKLRNGMEVVIDGRLSKRSYNDKNGVLQYITEVVANTIIFSPQTDNSSKGIDIRQSA